jgi:hypothetical protein
MCTFLDTNVLGTTLSSPTEIPMAAQGSQQLLIRSTGRVEIGSTHQLY